MCVCCCCYACRCYRSYRRYPFCHEMTRWCWLGFRCQKSITVHSSVSGSSCCCFECLVCFYCPVHVMGRIRTKTVLVDGSCGHNSIRFSCEIINGQVNDVLSASVLLCLNVCHVLDRFKRMSYAWQVWTYVVCLTGLDVCRVFDQFKRMSCARQV